jgi:predicted P-loop ATPase/GTPase
MNPFDSGKTELAIRLINTLLEVGFRVEYFKPVSGHNYWLHHAHTQSCLEDGLLVSKDAARARKQFEPKSEILLSNPVHALYAPVNLEKPLRNLTNTLALAGWSSVLVLERFSMPDNGGIETTMLMASRLLENEEVVITQEDAGRLSQGAGLVDVNSLEDVQEFEHSHFEEHVTASFKHLERNTEVIIIEGFNDAAWPFDGLKSVDSLLIVGPGHVYTYDPEKFRKGAYLMNRGNLPIREVTYNRVVDLLKPQDLHRIRPSEKLSTGDLEKLGIFGRTGKND